MRPEIAGEVASSTAPCQRGRANAAAGAPPRRARRIERMADRQGLFHFL